MPRVESKLRESRTRSRERGVGLERRLRITVLTNCPVCCVSGPTALLDQHLVEDHGHLPEAHSLFFGGAD